MWENLKRNKEMWHFHAFRHALKVNAHFDFLYALFHLSSDISYFEDIVTEMHRKININDTTNK